MANVPRGPGGSTGLAGEAVLQGAGSSPAGIDARRASDDVEQIAAIAETVQRSLLSDRLPDIVGLDLAARYRAGSAEAQVGGDWYDVVPLRNGEAGLAIGDVVGHGLGAAARMAQLKSALYAYAIEGLRPAVVLERMNAFVRELDSDVMATLVYGILDPDAGELRFASAGHPPPLAIVNDDEPRYLEGSPGSPLGAVPFPSYDDSIVPLAPGSLLLLYTDGLVERPDAPLEAGLEWMREFAGGLTADPTGLCAALLEACFRDAWPHDDVALLAARIEPVTADRIELSLQAEPESLAWMRQGVSRWLRGNGATEAEIYELLVACGEACSNAIAHAYPPGEASYLVTVTRAGDGVEVRVRDYGSWREPRSRSPGRGLALIEQLVDRFDVDRGSDGTTVTIWRRLGNLPGAE